MAADFENCKGCGCLFAPERSRDFCWWCLDELHKDPFHFKTMAEKEKCPKCGTRMRVLAVRGFVCPGCSYGW